MSYADYVSEIFSIYNNPPFFALLEVVEHACSITSLQMGEIVEGVSKDMDTYSLRQPLGICAGISPFNFPAMIPLWVKMGDYFLYSFITLFIVDVPVGLCYWKCNDHETE